MNKNYIAKARWLLLFTFFALLWVTPKESKAQAHPRDYVSSDVSVTWSISTGYLTIEFLYSEDPPTIYDATLNVGTFTINPPNNESSFTLFTVSGSDNSLATITAGSTVSGLYSNSGGAITTAATSINTNRIYTNGSNYWYRYITLKWKVPDNYYGKNLTVQLSGRWDKQQHSNVFMPGPQTLNANNFTYNIPITSLSPISITGYSFQASGNNAQVKLNWNKPNYNSSIDNVGTVYLYEGNTQKSLMSYSSSGVFQLNIDEEYLKSNHKYKVQHNAYDLAGHTRISGEYIVPAYPQVSSFTATYDPNTRKVKMEWKMPSPTPSGTAGTDYISGDKFQIQRATDILFTQNRSIIQEIDYDRDALNYSGDDDFSNMDVSQTYYYRIRRTHTQVAWDWNYFVKTANANVNTKHIELDSITVRADLDPNDRAIAKVTWQTKGSLWVNGSELTIKRINLTSSAETTVFSTRDSARAVSGSFTDDLITICNKYYYKIEIIPGSSSYRHNDAVRTNIITPIEIGRLTSFMADKGYNADKVVLEWTSSGRFNEFIVKRKPYGSQETPQTIRTIQGSAVSNSYQAEDLQGDPGIIYEYSVMGVVNCVDSTFTSNILTDIGFRNPVGIASGRITYGSGTAVENVRVLAEPLNPEDAVNSFKSLYFSNVANSKMLIPNAKKIVDTSHFSIQAWVRPESKTNATLFEAGTVSLKYTNNNTLSFTVGGNSITAVDTFSTNIVFAHITAVYANNQMALYINGERKASSTQTYPAFTLPATDSLKVGKGYKGYLDELRVWAVALDSAAIKSNYARYLTGKEQNLSGYWKFEEAVRFTNSDSGAVYDISAHGNRGYNKNDAKFYHCGLTDTIPEAGQLAIQGLTDANGNYVINAIPYSGNGINYKFVPMFQNHTFNPSSQLRMIGNNTPVQSSIDFVDNSSFKVNVSVAYEGTNRTYGVEGVSFAVDGSACIKDGQQIHTGTDGKAIIEVPIGLHSVTAHLNGHTFEQRGYFPYDAVDTTKKYDFQQPRNIEFTDNTKIKVVGRVVGGPTQAAYPQGFGMSTNNIGHAEITLETQNAACTFTYTDTVISNTSKQGLREKETKTRVTYPSNNKKSVIIYPDTVTGEFIAYLLPETYEVTSVKYGIGTSPDGSENFPQEYRTPLSMRNSYIWQELYKTKFDTVQTGFDTYEVQEVNIDTFMYQYTKDFVLRNPPTISVYNIMGNENMIYGDKEALFMNEATNQADTIPLINEQGQYTFGYPVFTQMQNYGFRVTAYEPYTNINNGILDKVPVTDGQLKITNNLSRNTSPQIISLDSLGVAEYSFTASDPSFSLNATNKDNSFLKNCAFVLHAGGADRTIPDVNGFITGGIPTGNNFVTVGPKIVDFILRDPPGSASSTSLESGVTVETTREYSHAETFGAGVETTFKFGADVKIFAGVGAGTITETEYNNNVVVGLENTNKHVNAYTNKSTTTTTNKISTSDSPDYVGADGDIFIGSATNIVYGLCNNLGLRPSTHSDTLKLNRVIQVNGTDYTIGRSQGMFLSPKFGTIFSYTQTHIEEALIPNLMMMRNLILRTDLDTNYVNNTTHPVYVSRITDISDENFGSNNNDSIIWGNQRSSDLHNGPSYKMILPVNPQSPDEAYTDSIRYYNAEIVGWIKVLAENEKQKINAILRENRSFDAGVTYENSIQMCNGSSSSEEWEVDVNITGGFETGFTVAGFGLGLKINANVGYTYHENTTTSADSCTTWSFTLADHDAENYYSVDIKEASNNSPVFVSRGGQSSCPYEDESRTKYYRPGQEILSYATMKIENPVIEMEPGFNPTVTDVPGNQPARFKIRMNNYSETNSISWFELLVDEASNPNGAVIEMDNQPVTRERVFRLLPNQDILKTIVIKRGPFQDINDYENIRLLLRSQCDHGNVDTLLLSAHFLPYCSDIVIAEPSAASVVTVNTITSDTLDIRLTDFDKANSKFSHVTLEYNNGAGWRQIMSFYNTQASYDAAIDPNNRTMITQNDRIAYKFNMHSLPDATYRLRAVSYCYPNGTPVGTPTATSISDEVTIIKDMLCPTIFGTIQPADGILDIGEDIIATFNESIADGLITFANFSINGVLNGYELANNAGVSFNGTNEYMNISQEMNLTGKSFTVEMWLQPLEAKTATLFTHGNADNNIEIGFNVDNRLVVKIAGNEFTSVNPVAVLNQWAHLGISYDAATNKVNAYWNDLALVFSQGNTASVYEGSGGIKVGSNLSMQNNFHGNMHELRIWSKALSQGTVYENMSKNLSGNENGLIGYWQMDEVRGTIAYDKARGRHATVNASWFVLPKGKAVSLNGTDQCVSANFVTPIGREQDFAISFWFKGVENHSSGSLFSLGKGMDDYGNSTDKLSIFVENNNLYIQSKGQKNLITVNPLLDGHWHHLAFSVKRNANAVVFIDGVKVKDMEANLFGGLTSDKFVLGARRWNTAPATVETDMYFAGQIDEFRMWQYALTQKIVELDINSKLTGTEKGLMAYYPFEKYQKVQGDIDVIQTLEDQWVNPINNAPNGGTAVWENGQAQLSDDAVSIKDARPLQDVNFTWVVNNDKINIIVDEPLKLIENCVLEFTMDGIFDKNGNTMRSPVKWTAYINRNYLKWSEEKVTLQKQLFEPMTFTVKAINKSGLQQAFSIDNLPQWLTASPASGTILPTKEQDIVFTVNEGLNVGKYDENVYLKGDAGIDEVLAIDLRVLGEKPDWNVDPSKYNYSMNIFGELNINGVISNDEEDMIAAFAGNTCVGVTKLKYVEEYDKYLAFLNVYGNTSGQSLSFKIWDAGTGRTYSMVTPDTLKFRENSYYGTAKTPITFHALNYIDQKINLKKGWNWISKNVSTSSMTTVNNAFAAHTFAANDQLKSQFNGFDQYTGSNWAGSITTSGGIKNSQMYMLKVTDGGVLTISGQPVNTANETITIYPNGWTWIGFTPQINLSLQEAFVSAHPKTGDLVKSQTAFSIYDEMLGWLGSLTYMLPGNGYIYYSLSQDIVQFTYPSLSSLSNNKKVYEDKAIVDFLNEENNVNIGKYQENLSIIAEVDASNIGVDDIILCYVDDECRGLGTPTYISETNKYLFFITVGGNKEGESMTFKLKTSNGEILNIKEQLKYKTNYLYGDVQEPIPFTLGIPENVEFSAYPVPFTTSLTVTYGIRESERGNVTFAISNTVGKKLFDFTVLHETAGKHTLTLSDKISALPAGVYFISMTTVEGSKTLKVVKSK